MATPPAITAPLPTTAAPWSTLPVEPAVTGPAAAVTAVAGPMILGTAMLIVVIIMTGRTEIETTVETGGSAKNGAAPGVKNSAASTA